MSEWSEWSDCWPPNLPPHTRVRANVKIPLDGGSSCWITVEDTAGAFTEFMEPAPDTDCFGANAADLGSIPSKDGVPVGGTFGSGEDFTAAN